MASAADGQQLSQLRCIAQAVALHLQLADDWPCPQVNASNIKHILPEVFAEVRPAGCCDCCVFHIALELSAAGSVRRGAPAAARDCCLVFAPVATVVPCGCCHCGLLCLPEVLAAVRFAAAARERLLDAWCGCCWCCGCCNLSRKAVLASAPPSLATAQNLIRGRGLFCRSIMKSQMASPAFTPGQ